MTIDPQLGYDVSPENNRGMPAFRLFFDDGTEQVSSAARGITIEQARKYWITGRPVEKTETQHHTIVRVEQVFQPK